MSRNTGDGLPGGVPTLFVVVTLVWLVGFATMLRGAEPYPALTQPAFRYVPDTTGEIHWTEVDYVVTFADGRSRVLSYRDVLPESAHRVDSIAAALYRGDAASDPDLVRWTTARLERMDLDGEAVRLDVWRVEVVVDRASLDRLDEQRTERVAVVDLTEAGS